METKKVEIGDEEIVLLPLKVGDIRAVGVALIVAHNKAKSDGIMKKGVLESWHRLGELFTGLLFKREEEELESVLGEEAEFHFGQSLALHFTERPLTMKRFLRTIFSLMRRGGDGLNPFEEFKKAFNFQKE